MQFLGLPQQGQTQVIRGDPLQDKFTLFFLDGPLLKAVVAANNMRDIRVSKRLMEGNLRVDANVLADEAYPLQELLKRGQQS